MTNYYGGTQEMIDETGNQMGYVIADVLGMDIVLSDETITGSCKRVMEVFEGYSPTVVSEITDSLVDDANGIYGACARIWGNLSVLVVNEQKTQRVTVFVYDRSKAPQHESPFGDGRYWSRKCCYAWLGSCCKHIYYRDVWDSEWSTLKAGATKLRKYNNMRKGTKLRKYNDIGKGHSCSTREAYTAMWGGT